MCDATLLLGATAMSAVSDIQAGREASEIHKYNQRILEQNAAAERRRASIDEQLTAREGERRKATQRAQLAKQGARLDEGSPLALQVEAAGNAEYEALLAGIPGLANAAELDARASLEGFEAKRAKRAGVRNAVSNIISTGSRFATMGA